MNLSLSVLRHLIKGKARCNKTNRQYMEKWRAGMTDNMPLENTQKIEIVSFVRLTATMSRQWLAAM